jgi:crotonobetainyl-CoA:carnitine CoA-transferase CaiB-like acyl-CoA transferase
MMNNHGRGPLHGIRVLDISTVYAAPITAMLLGDFGADVVKIEHPAGDHARSPGADKDGHGLWWKVISRNKVLARDTITTVDDEDLGPLKMQNVMFRMDATPGAIRFPGRRVGQDNHTFYRDTLRLSGAVRKALTVKPILHAGSSYAITKRTALSLSTAVRAGVQLNAR